MTFSTGRHHLIHKTLLPGRGFALSTWPLAFLLGVCAPAVAIQQDISEEQPAVNHCQAALPSFETAIRKRPLGMANEGDATAFVSCAMSAQHLGTSGMDVVTAVLHNNGAADAVVSCTLVGGRPLPLSSPSFFTKTLTLPAGQDRSIRWSSDDNNDNRFDAASLSCAIPPGAEVKQTQILYDIDMGL